MNKITAPAYAKINLSLEITGKREDGYHDIASVFQVVSLRDVITLSLGKDGIKISSDDKSLPTDEKNTCYRAAALFLRELGLSSAGVSIYIEKHIPSMAGLGGGSSDAASVLKCLNWLYGCPLSDDGLRRLGSAVGADVPFFIGGGTALCRGTGELITSLKPLKRHWVALIKPECGVSTPEAYKRFDSLEKPPSSHTPNLVEAINQGLEIASLLHNDLEDASWLREISEIKERLFKYGANGALMSGSGSCVFGLFDCYKACLSACSKLRGSYPFVRICHTI